ADQRGVVVPRMAGPLDDVARYVLNPAQEKAAATYPAGIGDAGEPVVAGKAEGVLRTRQRPAKKRQKAAFEPRPRNPRQHPPRLLHPANVRQRPATFQHFQKNESNRLKETDVLMRVDQRGRLADQLAEALVLSPKLRLDLGRGHAPQKE